MTNFADGMLITIKTLEESGVSAEAERVYAELIKIPRSSYGPSVYHKMKDEWEII